MQKILMIFIDGVGIGKEDVNYNPFFKYGFKTFEKFFGSIPSLSNPVLNSDGRFLFPVDARLGVEGLPLSGTGQTSIFCGVNAPELLGMHFGPYPHSLLIPTLAEKNIFKFFINAGLKATFANAYPKVFFDYINSGKKRLSATSLMCILNGMRLNRASDIWKGNALTAEITNQRWNLKLGYKLPIISPETAAEKLLKISSKGYFTLFEYFLTDHLGHGRYEDDFLKFYNELDNFLFQIFANFNYDSTTLIICSDHGNLEDISVKTHTYNPALMIAAGRNAKEIFLRVKNLSHIKDAVLSKLK